MKKFITVFLLILILSVGYGCTDSQLCYENTEVTENLHLYWKDVDVEVIDIDKKYWYSVVPRYEVKITVKNEEYSLIYTDTIKGSGAFGCPSQWRYKEGDIIKAELYSWVIDSTGEVVKRKIHRVY